MEELYRLGTVPQVVYNKYVFYKKAYWICFAYVLWDLFRTFGWL
jgi:hypothetical protein